MADPNVRVIPVHLNKQYYTRLTKLCTELKIDVEKAFLVGVHLFVLKQEYHQRVIREGYAYSQEELEEASR